MSHETELCNVLDAVPTDRRFQERVQRIGQFVQTLRRAAAAAAGSASRGAWQRGGV